MSEVAEIHHRWAPITGLEVGDVDQANTEVPTLLSVWDEMRTELSDRQVQEFNERLNREWAIETGIIENLYTLDEGTTTLLIQRGIDDALIPRAGNGKSPELIAGIVRDHEEAVKWLFKFVAETKYITTSFIKQLHSFITRKQSTIEGVDQFGKSVQAPLTHGAYKLLPNNPTRSDGKVHEYCPPEQVDSQMEELVRFHNSHIDSSIPPDVSAAWLHHRFTQIHPFQDGNGRVARALASLELIRGKWFPLVVNRTDRSKYIDALENADNGNLNLLIDLIGSIEKQWFLKALNISKEVKRNTERLEQMIEAINDDFRTRDQSKREEYENTKKIAYKIHVKAKKKFEEVTSDLKSGDAFKVRGRQIITDVGQDDDKERRTWHRSQIVSIAKNDLKYYANIRDYHTWVRLILMTESGRAEILLTFHAVGREYRGVIGAFMCFYRKAKSEGGEKGGGKHISELQPTSGEFFQLNYKEEPSRVVKRFEPWLESALLMGLGQWRHGE